MKSPSTTGKNRQGKKWPIGLLAGVFVVAPALACIDRTEPTLQVRQLIPSASRSTTHWPARRDILIGSVLSVLVPREAAVEISHLARGMLEPVTVIGDEALNKAARRIEYPEGRPRIEFDAAGHRWVHLYSSSFGKSRVVFKGSNNWTQAMTVGVLYPSEMPHGDPTPLDLVNPGETPTFWLSASSSSLWVSVSGSVEDGWRLSAGSDLGLALTRVEQLDVPYGDAPRVAVFLRGGRSVRAGSAVLQRNGDSPAAFQIRIHVRPTPAC